MFHDTIISKKTFNERKLSTQMTQFRRSSKRNFYIDWPLTLVLLGLSTISLTAIYGALPLINSYTISYDILYKQVIWIIIAIVLLVLLLVFGVDVLFSAIDYAYWILIGFLVLLLLDKVINLPFIYPINGTRAWITIPGLGTIQPSEFMKAVLIIKSSIVITNEHEKRGLPSLENDFSLFYELIKVVALPLVLIVMQPDTGIPLVIVAGLITMLAMSGVHKNWIKYGFISVIVLITLFLILFFVFPDALTSIVGQSYRLNRFYGWLETEQYIRSWGLQLYQALLAIGSAGLFGHGLGSDVITIIEPQNDFIFAVIGQNFGFIGTALTLGLEFVLDLIIINLLLQSHDYREKIMVSGVLGMLVFQQLQNMGMIVGLFPITGITLPFVSSGGSSLLSYVPALAIIYSISNENTAARVH